MLPTNKLRIFGLALIVCNSGAACASDVPPVACPQYFEYSTDGFAYFGRILLTGVPIGVAIIKASFSQRGLPRTSYYGSITPYPDEKAVIGDVLIGRPVKFQVDFPIPSEPPKLTRLSLNGQELCTASAYPPPNSWYDLSYTLHTLYTSRDHRFNFDAAWQYVPIKLDPRPVQASPAVPTTPGPTAPPPTTTTTTTTPAYTRPNAVERNVPGAQVDLNAVCGVEGTVVRPFIYGGTEVARGQFPWLTAVYKKDADALTFKCGGTLLSRRTVISAAHCFKGLRADQAALFFGRHDLQSYSENEIVSRDVLQVINHPNYKTNTPDSDLAILHMEPLDSFNQYIKPICLWTDSGDREFVVDKTATVVGWGFDEKGDADVSSLPKMVEVKIVSNAECLSSSEAFKDLITERTICAGNRDGRGPCIGDSGGGLMIFRRGRWVLRGVVSVGQSSRQQCNLYEYVIYCDLAEHMSWVRTNTLE